MMSFPGEPTTGLDWEQTWRRRGECHVCGVYSVLTASCGRCKKWACGKEDCVEVIRATERCGVPAVSL